MRRPSMILATIALAMGMTACASEQAPRSTEDPAPATPPQETSTGVTSAVETPVEPTPGGPGGDASPETDTGGTTDPSEPHLDGASAVLLFNDQRLSTTDPVSCGADGEGFTISQADAAVDDEFLTITMDAPDADTVESINMVNGTWMFAVDPHNSRGSAAASATPNGYRFTGEGEVRHVDDQEGLEEVDYTLVVACA